MDCHNFDIMYANKYEMESSSQFINSGTKHIILICDMILYNVLIVWSIMCYLHYTETKTHKYCESTFSYASVEAPGMEMEVGRFNDQPLL